MGDALQQAVALAQAVRFSLDSFRGHDCTISDLRRIRSATYQNGLKISRTVTSELARSMELAYSRLSIPSNTVEAFIYPSADIQADCFAGSTSSCLIRFSSALADLLDGDELAFVAGHEIGHFLLGHEAASDGGVSKSVEYFMHRRYQEISVDRIGLIACGSLDSAIRALMKTASGLNGRHLRFDVGTFLSQLQHVDSADSTNDTHPSLLIRCRALLWFSLVERSKSGKAPKVSDVEMSKLDKRVSEDFGKFVDGPARRSISEAKKNLAIWMAVRQVLRHGSFDKQSQRAVLELFDAEVLERLRSFLSNLSRMEAEEIVLSRIAEAHRELQDKIPMSITREVEEISRRIDVFLPTQERQVVQDEEILGGSS